MANISPVADNPNPAVAALVGELGIVEAGTTVVASGQTSLAVSFSQRHVNPQISGLAANYNAGPWYDSLTPTGFTLHFTDPGATKSISWLAVG